MYLAQQGLIAILCAYVIVNVQNNNVQYFKKQIWNFVGLLLV